MWVLSASTLILALVVRASGNKVEPSMIGFIIGILFALPQIRNSQPGAPPIGTTADVVGFFWNMLMISVAAVLLISNYISKTKAAIAKPAKQPVKQEVSTETLSLSA